MSVDRTEEVRLRDGQRAELIRIDAPDAEWVDPLCTFLNRPPTPLGPSLYRFLLTSDLPGLLVSFYAMRLAGEIVGCIVTSESSSVGYINSTFVVREKRRLGIARSLMGALEEDFKGGGHVRFFTTCTGSPAEVMFESFGYRTAWQRNGRTGMEQHFGDSSWDSYYQGEPAGAVVTEVDWCHWLPHRALMWGRSPDAHHPLVSDFESRMIESGQERCRWLALVLPEGQIVGEALLRRSDGFGVEPQNAHVLDMYVHPRFASERERLFDGAMPNGGHVTTFLHGDASSDIAWFEDRGFLLESRLRDDYNHHDPSTPDVRIYGLTV